MIEENFELVIPYMRDMLMNGDWVAVDGDWVAVDGIYPPKTRPANGKNIRLDIEMSLESFERNHIPLQADGMLEFTEEIKTMLSAAMALDIADLVVNGNTGSNDPLLKAFDGEVKQKTRFKKINISYIKYYQQYSLTKDTWEWTVFIVIGAE